MWKTTTVIFLIGFGLSHYYLNESDVEVPKLPDTFWGPEKNAAATKDIRPFTINVSKSVIDDLNQRLSSAKLNVKPLENASWTYGISSSYLKEVIDYWRTKYNWNKRQAYLNKYPQFVTNIQGLDIHFYHVKPTNLPGGQKVKVLPLLLVHGWPGSIVEFQKILPLLTTPHPQRDFVFEVIAPSLPGYGFSDGAVRPGLATGQIGVVFKNLMSRLGFEKFYVQGGDWGSIITSNMAAMYPERVIGAHSNMCVTLKFQSFFWHFVGTLFPSLVVEPSHKHKLYPMSNYWSHILEETGYFHLQSTKPDTIGTALMNSPVALAGYILEKFSTWTNSNYKIRNDGGLTEKYTLDELLDNLMIYWVTDSITTSCRLYAEQYTKENRKLNLEELPIKVPSGCASLPFEVVYISEKMLRSKYVNLIHFKHLPRGGHFAAMEEPALLADDIFTFVSKVEAQLKEKQKSGDNL